MVDDRLEFFFLEKALPGVLKLDGREGRAERKPSTGGNAERAAQNRQFIGDGGRGNPAVDALDRVLLQAAVGNVLRAAQSKGLTKGVEGAFHPRNRPVPLQDIVVENELFEVREHGFLHLRAFMLPLFDFGQADLQDSLRVFLLDGLRGLAMLFAITIVLDPPDPAALDRAGLLVPIAGADRSDQSRVAS